MESIITTYHADTTCCPTFDNNFQNFKSFGRIMVHPV
jgi:hypothetical protein